VSSAPPAQLARRSGLASYPLLSSHIRPHAPPMFVVTEADAARIRAAFERGGEFSAAVELRRLFPGIGDNAEARRCARTIAGWKPLAVPLRPTRLRRPLKGQQPPGAGRRPLPCPFRLAQSSSPSFAAIWWPSACHAPSDKQTSPASPDRSLNGDLAPSW